MTALNVALACFSAVIMGMIAAWRRYPVAGVIAIIFLTWIAVFALLVSTGLTEGAR